MTQSNNITKHILKTIATLIVCNLLFACQNGASLFSRALKSPFSYYIIVDLVKHSFYQVNNLYFKFEPKR